MRYDVAVVGLGAIGAAALAHFARRGVRAIGLERFPRGHAFGASSGETRIIRKAYFEDPAYVPLLERTYALWRELESETQRPLLDLVGVLLVGKPECASVAGAQESARRYGIQLEIYDSGEIARRFAGTTPHSHEIGVFEPEAGIVFPESGLAAHLEVAEKRGAEMRFETRVTLWERRDGTLRILLADGARVDATRIVVAPGMWTPQLLTELVLPLRVQRNVQVWFSPATHRYDRGTFPAFLVDRADLPAPLYGFPAMNGTLKAALHAYGETVDPEHLDRDVAQTDVARVRGALDTWMPGAAAAYKRGKVCTYTLTPDGNFIVDRHPSDRGVTIACGFSGHGYKFSPVIGEIVADLSLDGSTRFDIDFLRLPRFTEERD